MLHIMKSNISYFTTYKNHQEYTRIVNISLAYISHIMKTSA